MTNDALMDFRLPAYRELPRIGLYLDQTVQYINGFLTPIGFPELTPSMVSNYVKIGLIAPPVKKQYNTEQLAHLFFITVAKSVLSMDRIGLLVKMYRNSYTTDVAYDYFCEELKNMLLHTFGLKETLAEIGTRNSEEKTIFHSVICAVAHYVYIQHRLDAYTK